nr:DNA repair protein RadC [Brevundimonas diminuta]
MRLADAYGPPLDGMAEGDLLALWLRRRGAARDARLAAGRLLERFGGLAAIVAADAPELARTPGVDAAFVADLKVLRELCVRLVRSEVGERPRISSWTALLAYVRVALAHEPREQFRALFLDKRNALLRDEFVAHGTVDHAPVYPREVLRRALEISASALILVHNHPSGDPTPSRADIDMTRRLVEAAKVFDLEVHDHLVVGREATVSFRSLGLM